jgi:hypothetical protein
MRCAEASGFKSQLVIFRQLKNRSLWLLCVVLVNCLVQLVFVDIQPGQEQLSLLTHSSQLQSTYKRIGKHIPTHDQSARSIQQTDQQKSEDPHVYLSVHIDGYAEMAHSHLGLLPSLLEEGC